MQSLLNLKNVTTLRLHSDRCNGCGMCEIVCPHGVFEVRAGKAAVLERDACMECGACARNCQAGAIEVRSGVGCATAVITGAFKGTQPTCDCAQPRSKPCC